MMTVYFKLEEKSKIFPTSTAGQYPISLQVQFLRVELDYLVVWVREMADAASVVESRFFELDFFAQ